MIQNNQETDNSSPGLPMQEQRCMVEGSEAAGTVIYQNSTLNNNTGEDDVNGQQFFEATETHYLQQEQSNQMTTDIEHQYEMAHDIVFKDSLCTTSEQDPLRLQNSQSSLNKNIENLFKQEKVIQNSSQSFDGNQPIDLRNCVIQSSQTVNFDLVRSHKEQLFNLMSEPENGDADGEFGRPVQVRQKSRNTNSNLNNSPENQRSQQFDSNYKSYK